MVRTRRGGGVDRPGWNRQASQNQPYRQAGRRNSVNMQQSRVRSEAHARSRQSHEPRRSPAHNRPRERGHRDQAEVRQPNPPQQTSGNTNPGPPPHHVMCDTIPREWLQAMMGFMPPVLYDMMQARWREQFPEFWAQQPRVPHSRWLQPEVAGPAPYRQFGQAGSCQPESSRPTTSGSAEGSLTAAPSPQPATVTQPASSQQPTAVQQEDGSFSAASPAWTAAQQAGTQPVVPPVRQPPQVPFPDGPPVVAAAVEPVPEAVAAASTYTVPPPPQSAEQESLTTGNQCLPQGENNSSFTSQLANPLQVGVSPLSQSISMGIKQRIWSHEFIDLASLLKQDSKQQMRVELNQEGQLVCSPPETKGKILGIEKWTSAFLIFAYVYLERFGTSHPNKALELLQYIETIRFAASTYGGTGWITYDEKVRRGWVSPAQSFAAMNGEHWLRYITVGQRPTVTTKPANKLPCFDFNSGHCYRERCSFAHKCTTCGAYGHGAHQQQLCGRGQVKRKNPNPRPEGDVPREKRAQPFRTQQRAGLVSAQNRQVNPAPNQLPQ